ncbi:MBL fold metallo-hydrolase [Thioclava sp. FR2]|uniref:MBL fold metallo-hydrolase n=1 Tax=Thioclava sp. FR2 TaxID=3445780 RepID=UPI003EBF39A3
MKVLGDKLTWQDGSLTRLLDGKVSFGRDFFPDPRGAEIPEVVELPVHCYLLQRQGLAPVLIDTGSGDLYGDKGGGLKAALASNGVTPDDIDAVLMTHMHGDHCGGLLSLDFANATVFAAADEIAYWPTQNHPSARFLANATNLHPLKDGERPLPGLRLWSLPGHTPGHAGYVIDGKIAVIGDVLHRADIQLPDPLIATKFDVNRELATNTRLAALEQIAKDGLVTCGGHFQARVDGSPFLKLQPTNKGYKALAL